jgi:hypothetical protein
MGISDTNKIPLRSLAADVSFADDAMYVRLLDGRVVGVPLAWFPVLQRANDEKRRNWRLIGRSIGIHWDDLDEDISVEGLLRP